MKSAYPESSFTSVVGTYSGLIVVLLFTLADSWSGIASLITFYLILGAPVVMGIVAFRNYLLRKLTVAHRLVFYAAVAYFFIGATLLTLAWVYWTD